MTAKKDAIGAALGDLNKIGDDPDDEFVVGDQRLGGGLFRHKSDAEIVIDRLFNDCNDFSFLKLHKEIAPNEFQFKEKIPFSIFGKWADAETEVTEYVRNKTKLEISKIGRAISWGSARYQLVVFNDGRGMRENGRSMIYSVDAKEYEIEIPTNLTGAISTGSDIAQILRTIQGGSLAPGDILKEQAAAMRLGAEMAGKKEDAAVTGNNQLITMMMNQQAESTKMMLGLITAIISGKPVEMPKPADPIEMMRNMTGIMRDAGAFREQIPPKEQDMLEIYGKWKMAGLIPERTDNKPEDPFAQITKMKQIMGFMQELTGAGPTEKPGILEKLIDVAGPQLANMLTAGMQLMMQNNAPKVIQANPPQIIPQANPAPSVHPVNEAPNVQKPAAPIQQPSPAASTESEEEMQLSKIKAELKDFVTNNRTEKYPYLNNLLMEAQGDSIMVGVKMGSLNADSLVSQIKLLDMLTYMNGEMSQKLKQYVEGFVSYIKTAGFDTVCDKCKIYSIYENRAQYLSDPNKICERDSCGGHLNPVV